MSREFRFQCAFCDATEFSFGSFTGFHVDHFRPKSNPDFASLIHEWSNLYYVCADCNSIKNDFWPTEAERSRGYTLVDPAIEDPFEADIRITREGIPEAATTRGECMITVFQFDQRPAVHARWKERRDLVRRIARQESLLAAIAPCCTPENSEAVEHYREVETILREDEDRYRLYFLGWDTRRIKRKKQ